jgi:hypothetical protein
MICKTDGCDKIVHSQGVCRACYQRKWIVDSAVSGSLENLPVAGKDLILQALNRTQREAKRTGEFYQNKYKSGNRTNLTVAARDARRREACLRSLLKCAEPLE